MKLPNTVAFGVFDTCTFTKPPAATLVLKRVSSSRTAFVAVTAEVRAEDAFYKGKRLTVLVNYAPGGSTDAEARVFVRHIGRVLEGQPGVIIQNMEGAGGFAVLFPAATPAADGFC